MTTYEERIEDFWAFCTERHSAYERRAAGQPFPWSEMQFLATHRFTNIYRELDAGTRWIRANRPPMIRSAYAGVFAYSLYRWLNFPATFEAIGFPDLTKKSIDDWHAALMWRVESGINCNTSRHRTPHPKRLGDWALQFLDRDFRRTIEGDLILAFNGVELAGQLVENVKGIGPFFAVQVVADLIRDPYFAPRDKDTFMPLAVGSRMAADYIITGEHPIIGGNAGGNPTPRETLLLTDLHDEQPKAIGDMGPDKQGPMTYTDIEHALCEAYKYFRLREGKPARANRYP
jgi:hypothetical protein